MKRISLIIAAGLLSLGFATANAQQDEAAAASMSELMRLIEQGQARDSREARQREAAFAQAKNQQQSLLNQARAERTRQENTSSQLENEFGANQQSIITARQALDERMGALKELLGVLQTVAGDAQGRFASSLTNVEYPNRDKFLVELGSKLAGASNIPEIEEIERLWALLQQEVVESGKVTRFNHLVTRADGTEEEMEVVRVGSFNLASDNGYLEFNDDGTISELLRQPDGKYLGTTDDLMDAGPGEVVPFGVDVTRGGILSLLVESPTIKDRIEQGGIVGYCIIALGLIGLLIAVMRWLALSTADRKVKAQLKRDTASTDNPLGRVLAAYESNRGADTETIELKLSEAALKEMPGLTKGLLFIKVVSAVAPLMGLLGTVTGMIKTFQVITLYGAGDPKMMAGGISQALMTTVLGLVVAIPMVLLHTVVSGKSRKIVNILQSQSAGLVAQHSERSK
ncbi:MAG: MotA/TolQ/ExbB proton channel family protein [Gammaproteobacteria bacterium]|nr:MotA/TolQ/ExbB proton channel family protein [Gammaproteobacteria bacterium]